MNTNTMESQPSVTGIGPADLLMMNPAQGSDRGGAEYDDTGSGATSGYGDELAKDLNPQNDETESDDLSQELNETVKDDLDDDALN
jgi:hypothetical protein